jgi:hypothetical protein
MSQFVKRFRVHCRNDGSSLHHDGNTAFVFIKRDTKKEVVEYLIQHGWRQGKNSWFCPACIPQMEFTELLDGLAVNYSIHCSCCDRLTYDYGKNKVEFVEQLKLRGWEKVKDKWQCDFCSGKFDIKEEKNESV